MLTQTITENGTTITFDHSDKWFQTFDDEDATNNLLSGDYVAAGGTGRDHFWLDKETLMAYVPNAISFEKRSKS